MSRSTHYPRYAHAVLRSGLAVIVLTVVSAGVVAARGSAAATGSSATDHLGLSAALMSSSPAASPSATVRPAQQAAAQQAVAAKAAAGRAAAVRAAAERRTAAARAARSALHDPRSAARLMLADHSWSAGQFQCLDALWSKESGWNHQARNASSGAFGIPQALPGGKMASAGADWQTNPVTQIRWGLKYIDDVYGSPCGAWAHSRASNWY
ncbi:MAG TPA: hypothetical protein VHN80_27185 [Kineosporiaceae bacterium]|nr:hypothetical protein [Kineosporiaceae bacterium]